MLTNNPISQNDDDQFYTAVFAYVRGEPNGVVPGTVGEEQAEIAKRVFQDNSSMLKDKSRLLAEIATINYRERGFEAAEARFGHKEADDNLFINIVAFVRDQPHHIERDTIDETWANYASQLAAEDPNILDDQYRLLVALGDCARKEAESLGSSERWRIHYRRINRDCISKAEFERRMEKRRAAGLLIDPATAEIGWWYAHYFDPYEDGLPLFPEQAHVSDRECFARAPDSDIWVFVDDLPKATGDAIWKRLHDPTDRH
jgi:hypothetical protein